MNLASTLNRAFGARAKRGRSPRTGSKLLNTIRAHERVRFIDIEPQDGWFVTLQPGWKYAGDPCLPTHAFGARTLTEAMRDVKAALPCVCDQCQREADQ